MKWPLSRKATVITGGVLAIAVIVGVLLSNGSAEAEMVTDTVKRGRLVQSVEVTGEVKTITELELAFEQTGTVSTVSVDVGDTIGAGQVLASLRAADLYADVVRAQAALDRELAGSSVQDIAIAQADVDVATAALSAAEVDLAFAESSEDLTESLGEAQTQEAEAALVQTELNLTQIVNDNALDVANAHTALREELIASVIDVRSALSDADQILGIENSIVNNDFQDQLSATDPQALTSADNSYDFAADARDSAEVLVYALTALSSAAEVDSAVAATRDALADTSLTLLYTRQVLDATSGGSADLSFDELEAFKTSIDTARNTIQAQQSLFENAVESFDLTTLTANDLEDDAEQAVTAAELALASAQATELKNNAAADQQVANAAATLAMRQSELLRAQAQLSKVESGPRAVDLGPLEADLLAAQARLAKAQIVSPIDGVVTRVALETGEQASPGVIAIEVQAIGEVFEIPVFIPESDIAKITVGDRAEVTLDAYSDDLRFAAYLLSIDPAETVIEGVVYYEATVVFAADQDLSLLKSGMSADVEIFTEVREDTLYVPQRAILERDGVKYARIPDNKGEYVERTVSVGIRGNGGLLEVLSGLSEGETVIVSLK